jgi:hypothetical protein
MNQTSPVASVIIRSCDWKLIWPRRFEAYGEPHSAWELILVARGSPDGTRKIVRKYTSLHLGRIRPCRHDRKRSWASLIANPRRRAREVRGARVIGWDDTWHPQFLERQLANRPHRDRAKGAGPARRVGGPFHTARRATHVRRTPRATWKGPLPPPPTNTTRHGCVLVAVQSYGPIDSTVRVAGAAMAPISSAGTQGDHPRRRRAASLV